MTAQRKLAISSGYALLLMAVVACFSFGYAFPVFYTEGEPGSSVENIQANQPLYIAMMSTLLLIILLDVFGSYTLCYFFKNDIRNISLNSFYLRMFYTAIFAVANYFLLINFDKDVSGHCEDNPANHL